MIRFSICRQKVYVVILAIVSSFLFFAHVTQAQGITFTTSDSTKITLSAFIDSYYAWDFGRPKLMDRSFAGGALLTTQPARHNEFNVNLAFIDLKLESSRLRGRLALQTGTSVQSNYSGEPTQGQVSGPSASRLLQEASIGVKVADRFWIDGGIFFSHMGMEGWISRDNPTYTRSLVAEYSPYYQSGIKLTYLATDRLTAQLNVVNGWQNISENNKGKGAGIRLDYAPTSSMVVSYYNFFSDEAGSRLRTFNGVGGKVSRGRMTYLAQFDVGTQKRPSANRGTSTWYGVTAIARAQVTPNIGVSGRVERYDDKDQVIVATGAATPGVANGAFRANGFSLGIDVAPQARVMWRTEVRGLRNADPVFPNANSGPKRDNALLVSSLALTL